ncbi:ead/Ea22-like family protein [Enterobacter cloacae]|uniref:ead/Ea22-like family protein n=1 Tax=Enterobacter cloacae TaxID=550 RepID=UPI002FD7B9D7
MSNIDKQAVTAKTKELASLMVERISMNPVSCKLLNEAWEKEFPDEVAIAERMLALLDELEASQSENERLAKALIERNGEPVEGLVKRVAELEEIATDYGMKFQRAQDALKHQSLLHKSQMEAAEKRIAELEAREVTLPAQKYCPGEYAGSVLWGETEVWNQAISECAKAIRAAGIGKGE